VWCASEDLNPLYAHVNLPTKSDDARQGHVGASVLSQASKRKLTEPPSEGPSKQSQETHERHGDDDQIHNRRLIIRIRHGYLSGLGDQLLTAGRWRVLSRLTLRMQLAVENTNQIGELVEIGLAG
jgi:hypothetical protein